MQMLKEFFHNDNLNLKGEILLRESIKGIILDGDKILMIYSPVNGDYKFAGGGMKSGENHESTLIREIREECGATVTSINGEFGYVTEYKIPYEDDHCDVFQMNTYYYFCEIDKNLSCQTLDQYEKDLLFEPRWITIDDAINTNNKIIESSNNPRWTERDNYILKKLKENISQTFLK